MRNEKLIDDIQIQDSDLESEAIYDALANISADADSLLPSPNTQNNASHSGTFQQHQTTAIVHT